MVSLRRLKTYQRAHRGDPDNEIYWKLLLKDISDREEVERPNDASTRAIRYAAVMNDRLWAMLQGERIWVRPVGKCLDLLGPHHLLIGGLCRKELGGLAGRV